MYTVTVSEPFVAQHYLTVPDPGPEGELHSHRFEAEATFCGPELAEYGYLLDIDHAIEALEAVVETYRDETLNERLSGNPSAERLAEAIHADLAARVTAPAVESLSVTVREDETALVSYDAPI
ncbi:MAG: 6-carboxytetrahydropterin synthase [Natronomonas sp.]